METLRKGPAVGRKGHDGRGDRSIESIESIYTYTIGQGAKPRQYVRGPSPLKPPPVAFQAPKPLRFFGLSLRGTGGNSWRAPLNKAAPSTSPY